jgi:hypothetical protein
MSRWSHSTYLEFISIDEVLDWAVQLIMSVYSLALLMSSLTLLNKMPTKFWLFSFCTARIKLPILWAHISSINCLAKEFGILAPGLRSSFPVKYAPIDLGHSIQFCTDVELSTYKSNWPVPREQSAPETICGEPFDPFASDVYQTERTIFG